MKLCETETTQTKSDEHDENWTLVNQKQTTK